MSASKFFLVIADRARDRTEVVDLGINAAQALAEYERHESEAVNGVEVVLLGSDSEETLRRTHSSLFGAGKGLHEALGSPSG